MSAASQGIWGAGSPALGRVGLAALVFFAACGGEGREPGNAGTTGAAVTDSAATRSSDTHNLATADTAAPAATDTSAAGTTKDTAARQAQRPPAAKPTPAVKPTPARPTRPTPTQPAKPAPATPAPAPTQDTAAATPDTGASTQDTAAPTPDTAAPTQDTAVSMRDTSGATQDTATAPGSDTAAGETQTADAPLRDQYHQAPRDTVDQATYDGWKQYNLNCARCHGEDVLGSTIAPHLVTSLKPDGPINTKEKFTEVVCAGRPEKGMPAWCALGLDQEKISQIHAYVKGRSEGKIGPGRPAVKPEG